ncbi:hypothetical protein PUR34_40810 [Streptomyces sp. JV185]|nr:hypothetical protein [Streptomyces sp. JV185]MEE1774349.1 hypothetical protein [Streptomyces sp. JV185]
MTPTSPAPAPALDKEIRATGETADLDERIAAVNKVEQKALQ